jgi:DNA-binding IclR family transcriptional regulator
MKIVDRLTEILDILSKYKEGLGIKEISTKLHLPLSTTHRLLKALEENELVSQEDLSKRYKIGIKILSMSSQLLNEMDIVNISRPILEELSTKHKQLIFLSVLENKRSICVDMVNNSDGMKFYVRLGTFMPAHCSASGKAIVAFLKDNEIKGILKEQKRKKFTEKTIMKTDDIIEDLKNVKNLKYAVCDEEMEIGVRALAVPIFGRSGDIKASITIMLMKQFEFREDEILDDLKRASKKISSMLGYIE